MNDRKKYYALDEIGFIGVQKEKSPLEEKREQIKTGEEIRKIKAALARKAKKAS